MRCDGIAPLIFVIIVMRNEQRFDDRSSKENTVRDWDAGERSSVSPLCGAAQRDTADYKPTQGSEEMNAAIEKRFDGIWSGKHPQAGSTLHPDPVQGLSHLQP